MNCTKHVLCQTKRETKDVQISAIVGLFRSGIHLREDSGCDDTMSEGEYTDATQRAVAHEK